MSDDLLPFEFGKDRAGQPRKYSSPRAFEFEVEYYFDITDVSYVAMYHKQLDKFGNPVELKVKQPYTIEGLCLHLGITRQTLLNYENESKYTDKYRHLYKEFFDIITRARMRITQQRVVGGLIGAMDPNFAKFLLINTTDMVEKSEQKVVGAYVNTNINSEPMSPERIREIAKKLEDEC